MAERAYLDHNATTPLHPEVLEAMLPYLQGSYGNPSSVHWFGQQARRALQRARRQVATLIGAAEDEVVFTSGGTEADNLAIRGSFGGRVGDHLVTSAAEHSAVLNPARELANVTVTLVGVDREGVVDADGLLDAICDRTQLVSVMLANNEVGTIQPVGEIAERIRRKFGSQIMVHTDAVQALGKVPVDVAELQVDLLSLSGHKVGGPKGIGALYVRRGRRLDPQLRGGDQERKLRGGTENVAAAVGLGQACERLIGQIGTTAGYLSALRDQFERRITRKMGGVTVNGAGAARVSNTSNVAFAGISGEALLMRLDLAGFAASTGSACASGRVEPSHVLLAMGRTTEEAKGALRVSLGEENTTAEIDRIVTVLLDSVPRLRAVEGYQVPLQGARAT